MTTFNSIGVGRTIGAGLNDLHATDFQISTNSTNGIITINLPPISDVLSERFKSGYFQLIAFLIADISGTAGTFKTTINASSGELINGVSSIDLDTNNYSALLTITSDNAWSLVSGVTSGGGGGSINPINYAVFVGKNGNDATADGSIAKPFLTVQAGINHAYTLQSTSPATRPVVFVMAGTYTEDCVLKANVFVKGLGVHNTRISGNWTIDNTFTPSGDFRSGFIDIGIFGNVTVDFNSVSSNEGKIFVYNSRITGAITMNAFSSINQFLWFGGEFFGLITISGFSTQLNGVVDQAGSGIVVNSNANSNVVFSTEGGVISNLTFNATVDRGFSVSLAHAIKSSSILTLNNTTPNLSLPSVNATITSLPIPSNIVFNGSATKDNITEINPIWIQGGNKNGSIQSIGTLDNFDFPIIVDGAEVGRFTTDKRLFLGDTKTNNGSNAGMQYSSLIANRSQLRENQYGANNAGGGITTFKSRGLIIGEPVTPAVPANNVQVGDIIQGFTAIGLTDNGAGVGLIPLAYTQRVIVTRNANGSVACDWEVSLCPLNGTTNSIRKAFGFTSEGIQKTLETANGMSGLAVLDATGTIVVANTNVKASTKFMLTVQDGGTAPTGNVYQSSRVNGTSFTIKSNAGVADAGVQVYYQLYEPIV